MNIKMYDILLIMYPTYYEYYNVCDIDILIV